MSVREVGSQGGYNLLQNYSAAVLDVRSREEFAANHILEAHHFDTADWGSLRMREEILVYGDSLTHVHSRSGEVLTRLRGPRLKFRVLHLLSTPFQEFAAGLPFFCGSSPQAPQALEAKTASRSKSKPRTEKRPRYPSEIIQGGLYHGHKMDASRAEVAQNLKLTHVVNVTRNIPCFFEASEGKANEGGIVLKYLCLMLDDTDNEDLTQALSLGPAFIEHAIKGGGRVLVHCQEGLSRSSAVVLAYLLQFTDRMLADAIVYLAGCRPIIQPNEGFVDQLALFERKLYPHRPASRGHIPPQYVRPRPVGTKSTLSLDSDTHPDENLSVTVVSASAAIHIS